MSQPKMRAGTLQEKFGLQDKDLTTPAHDAIMIWLDQRADEIADSMLPISRAVTAKIPSLITKAEDYVREIRNALNALRGRSETGEHWAWTWTPESFRSTFPVNRILDKQWEYPVTSPGSKGFVIGFLDMVVSVVAPDREPIHVEVELNPRPPFISSGSLPCDIIQRPVPKWSVGNEERSVCFEVKTSIPSVGELIRQINFYRNFKWGIYVVVSPDDRFASILESQNIRFIKCPAAKDL